MIRIFVILLTVTLLSSCGPRPVPSLDDPQGIPIGSIYNPKFRLVRVEGELFILRVGSKHEHDELLRFSDFRDGRAHFSAQPPSSAAELQKAESLDSLASAAQFGAAAAGVAAVGSLLK